MPRSTLGGLAAVQLAGLSCLSSRSLRFFSLSLQRNILSTSLASFSFSRLSPTVSSDYKWYFALTHHFCRRESRSQLTGRRRSSASPLAIFVFCLFDGNSFWRLAHRLFSFAFCPPRGGGRRSGTLFVKPSIALV